LLAEAKVARATWRDVPALWRLERACFAGDAYDPLTLWTLVAWPGLASLKATVKGDLAGFIAGDEPWGDACAWIVTLGVAPRHQRQSIGAEFAPPVTGFKGNMNLKIPARLSKRLCIPGYHANSVTMPG